MASVYRKAGATGKTSPFWQARLKGIDGERVWFSTKQTNQKRALQVAEYWEGAIRLAERQELNTAKANQILKAIEELIKAPDPKGMKANSRSQRDANPLATLKVTRVLLDDLLRQSIQEELKGQNFAQYCQEWLAQQTEEVEPSSWAKYRGAILGFLNFLPKRRRSASVASITSGEIERFRTQLRAEGRSASTVNNSIGIIRALFNSARRRGIIAINPAEALEPLRSVTEERECFTDKQIKELLAKADPEQKGLILFGFHAGLRLRDAAELNWSNLDLEKRQLSFTQRKTGSKNGKIVLALHRDIVSYLRDEAVTSDDPKAPVFPSFRGRSTGSTNGLSAMFGDLMDKAGIEVPLGKAKTKKGRQFKKLSFHSLRHSFVSRLANAGIGPDVRKKFVGHADDRTHDIYTHLDADLQAAAIEKLSSVF